MTGYEYLCYKKTKKFWNISNENIKLKFSDWFKLLQVFLKTMKEKELHYKPIIFCIFTNDSPHMHVINQFISIMIYTLIPLRDKDRGIDRNGHQRDLCIMVSENYLNEWIIHSL